MRAKNILALFISICIAFSLVGCNKDSNNAQKNNYPVTISNVTINNQPNSIVVLSDSLADIILAQCHEIKLKARSDSCSQEELKVLPSVGSLENLDLKAIKDLAPQVVLSETELSKEQTEELQKSNINVIVLNHADSRDSLEQLYSDIGKIMAGNSDGVEKASKVIKNILLTVDDITRLTQDNNVIHTACYFYDENTIATGDTFIDDIIQFAGAVNIAHNSRDNKMDNSAIRLSNPEYIFCAPGVKAKIKSNADFASLDAVVKDRIFEIDSNVISRQGRSIISNVTFIAGKIRPDLASDGSSTTSETNNVSSAVESSASVSKNEAQQKQPLTTLKLGDQGDNVLKMQQRLDELDYMHVAPNGVFTAKTMQSVKDFQFLNNMSTSGVADETTLNLLFSGNAVKRPDPAREK